MGIMTTRDVSNIQSGWSLPGVQDLDLFCKMAPDHALPFRLHPGIDLPSSFSKARTGQKFNCRDAYGYNAARQTCLPSPDQGFLKLEPDVVPQFASNLQTMFPKEVLPAAKSELQLQSPPDTLKARQASIAPFNSIFPSRPARHLASMVAIPMGTHSSLEAPICISPAGRITSNEKHKVSEKHRRDVMGAVVQAIDIIGKDINPAIGSLVRHSCITCIEAPSQYEDLCISLTQPENSTAVAIGSAFKKTKNYILLETLMWKFSAVLHHYPDQIASELDNIRTLVEQMTREKEAGLSNDFAKSNKWSKDVRAQRLKKVLKAMVLDCARHGVEVCACGKHHCEVWEAKTSAAIQMPLSSMTSPVVGLKRSREESDGEDRNPRRIDDMFLARL